MDDVVQIIDCLEDVLLNNKRAFFSGKIYVDQVKVTEMLSRLREAVPASFHEAKSIISQRDALIYEAEQRAENIIRTANDTREKLIAESEVLKSAQTEAENILNSTRDYCDNLKYNVLHDLDSELYNSAIHLNETLDYIDGMRSEMRKRFPMRDTPNN